MNKNLPDIKRDGILLRIKNFFYKSRYKNEKESYSKSEYLINNKTDFFEEERAKSKRHAYLLELQNKFEEGKILESEISEEDNKDLKKIYMEQIGVLKSKIARIESQL